MLQIDTRHYASDALEDAMRLAQTKSLNSYTFSDMLSYLNYAWSDIYNRMAAIDDGYYGVNIKLTKAITTLPPYVKNTVQVYSAQSPVGYNRLVFRASGTTDMTSPSTYHLSGFDLYCPDAVRRTVWLYYVPACPQVFFTHHNRDPKLYPNTKNEENEIIPGKEAIRNTNYNLYTLQGKNADDVVVDIQDISQDLSQIVKWELVHKGLDPVVEDISGTILAAPLNDENDGHWQVSYISCDFPYIFVSYKHSLTNEYMSGFFDSGRHFNIYNPFAFIGRNSNVEYLQCKYNDKTGMGVIIKDHNDLDEFGVPRIKELGWTPDTILDYPVPEMYRYLVARLADKLAALNESNIMGVQKELVESKYAFEAHLNKDKSSWQRITNVNPPTIGDYL
jgi:hypothetical protein